MSKPNMTARLERLTEPLFWDIEALDIWERFLIDEAELLIRSTNRAREAKGLETDAD